MTVKREVTVQKTPNGWWQVVADGEVIHSYRGGHREAEETASRLRIHAAVLDDHLPLRGPCGLCGSGADQTHRVIDAIASMARAHADDGDDYAWIAAEFDRPAGGTDLVDACLAWSPR